FMERDEGKFRVRMGFFEVFGLCEERSWSGGRWVINDVKGTFVDGLRCWFGDVWFMEWRRIFELYFWFGVRCL
ncbi:hypothetical protein, partial [Bacillus pumilus]|uniref:hypothetical protein n=1 Tax=Bacillus pumilus TaxID=1408 RepID=UPI001C92F9EE